MGHLSTKASDLLSLGLGVILSPGDGLTEDTEGLLDSPSWDAEQTRASGHINCLLIVGRN